MEKSSNRKKPALTREKYNSGLRKFLRALRYGFTVYPDLEEAFYGFLWKGL